MPWVGVLEDSAAAFGNKSHAKLPQSRLFLAQGESGSCWHENSVLIQEVRTLQRAQGLVRVHGQNPAMEMHRGHGSLSCSVPG